MRVLNCERHLKRKRDSDDTLIREWVGNGAIRAKSVVLDFAGVGMGRMCYKRFKFR